MQRHEYKVIPAPRRGTKSREARTPEDRFALTLAVLMNELGREGWEYLRSETLPSEERVGFTRMRRVDQTVMIFRRDLDRSAGPVADGPAAPRPIALTAEAAGPRLGPAVEPEPGAAPQLGKAE